MSRMPEWHTLEGHSLLSFTIVSSVINPFLLHSFQSEWLVSLPSVPFLLPNSLPHQSENISSLPKLLSAFHLPWSLDFAKYLFCIHRDIPEVFLSELLIWWIPWIGFLMWSPEKDFPWESFCVSQNKSSFLPLRFLRNVRLWTRASVGRRKKLLSLKGENQANQSLDSVLSQLKKKLYIYIWIEFGWRAERVLGTASWLLEKRSKMPLRDRQKWNSGYLMACFTGPCHFTSLWRENAAKNWELPSYY